MTALHLGLALFAATVTLGIGIRLARCLERCRARWLATDDGYDPDDGGAA